jgi:hypothetical protein
LCCKLRAILRWQPIEFRSVDPTPGTGAHGPDEAGHQSERTASEGLPGSGTEQTCAFCGCAEVIWVHPLATDRVQFRRFGKNDTVQSFWTLCQSCEELYQDGEDDRLIALMKSAGDGVWQGTDVEDVLRKPVDVFREADLGRRELGTA